MLKVLLSSFLYLVAVTSSLQAIPTWEWVSPSKAVISHNSPDGFEASNNTYLFVCRARANDNRWIPGKLLLGAGEAKCWVNLGIGYLVEAFEVFQMLVAEPGSTAWVRVPDREIPPQAIPAGEHLDGTTSYSCRGKVYDNLVPGVWNSEWKQCYVVLDGGETYTYEEVEILVTSALGKLLEERLLKETMERINENQTDIVMRKRFSP